MRIDWTPRSNTSQPSIAWRAPFRRFQVSVELALMQRAAVAAIVAALLRCSSATYAGKAMQWLLRKCWPALPVLRWQRNTTSAACPLRCSRPDWEVGPWGTCTTECGGGNTQRAVQCVTSLSQPAQSESACRKAKPATDMECNAQPCRKWRVSHATVVLSFWLG
jgi:hypothetical protein